MLIKAGNLVTFTHLKVLGICSYPEGHVQVLNDVPWQFLSSYRSLSCGKPKDVLVSEELEASGKGEGSW